ncbi:hypothetical protein Poly24_04400 [Rosistilla carotiformis]|uniref:Uncharacterized protein n=1 Tax=Rosistilla carotiformis TaxID=2528017 RepID=A0A518JMJ2_9BACT|nr:hypothetical protein Poly24_04400 [Rosistilla carotiformis]
MHRARPSFTRPAELGGSGNERLASFPGEGHSAGLNAVDLPCNSPPRTSLRWFDPPLQAALGEGEVINLATPSLTRPAELGGSDNERLASFPGRAGPLD